MITTKKQLKKWTERYAERHNTTVENAMEIAKKGEWKLSHDNTKHCWLIYPKIPHGWFGDI